MEYVQRTYRNLVQDNFLKSFHVCEEQTDLFIQADHDLTGPANSSVHLHRVSLKNYILTHPRFLTSLNPLPDDPLAPPIVKAMLQASRLAGVGPMAAVAGAMAEFVGKNLLKHSLNVIIENGGDLYLKATRALNIAVFAGKSPLSYRVALKIRPEDTPLGICTSSATVGHSLSLGIADAVCVKAKSAALADAAATAIGNTVQNQREIKKALEAGRKIQGVLGVLIIVEKSMGVIGNMELN
ncbi:MAG: hypothetical protein A4E70_00221 [Syntrophus sp. PtaU1.Bin005]|jgi:ApbE superfamily uncharacterized protein (UPF0280 family)|uniref:UPF0280 family protein n=1 Tax=Syntrophus TaxID=43773 RepID=UPI0009D20A43|nr:MAG: hypothetical protein A4E69_00737 [Syntrophus sp. PtaB.Bin138]OPY83450.1 MAG: hypothetical protein A4E70_00221 [Syntrophus sp. PtaU1.Bin005]